MKLGAVTLPGGQLAGISPSARQAIHEYDWSHEVAVTDMGSGPTTMTVSGILNGTTERLAVIAACESARSTETNLYFPSVNGASDDYYYRVQTGPCRLEPVTGNHLPL